MRTGHGRSGDRLEQLAFRAFRDAVRGRHVKGEAPARIWTPGAVMSGLLTPSVWPGPPRELNEAMTSACCDPLTPALIVAMTPVWAPRKASSATPAEFWTWLAGRKWLSVSWSVTAALWLYRIMPTAPPWRTL